MVELKVLTESEMVHLVHALNYLEAYKMEIGLMINFGNTKLEFIRLTIQNKLEKGIQS